MSGQPENVRPWGRYDVIDGGDGYRVKRITVNPGKRLSYQSHGRRSEFWVVVSGTAVLTLDGNDRPIGVGESAFIPVQSRHRVSNPGGEPMVFIEIQIGDYLGEDDIVRYEDDFGREGTVTPHGE
ncbi:phosphomannose isomerase type II C-terminal cupin domain [Candidatus Uhrbacteria bacterium]|nr:phosphomannose isomerase type II C-terminal cupin domain [Candidatus Uhrbacteria bacterium]